MRCPQSIHAACLVCLLALAACNGRPEAGAGGLVAAGGASGPATASRSPIGIVPAAEETAGSGVPGPGAGATAVGGVAGRQESGGAKTGGGPAPTAGDGAGSAGTKPQ